MDPYATRDLVPEVFRPAASSGPARARQSHDLPRAATRTAARGIGSSAGMGVVLAFALAVGVAVAHAGAWVAPRAETTRKNPVPRAKASIEAGRALAMTNCAPCHGTSGRGDGPGAAALLPAKPADWTSKPVQSESDGALFWKITTGNPPMPSWQSLPEKDRWNLVNYVKSLGKK